MKLVQQLVVVDTELLYPAPTHAGHQAMRPSEKAEDLPGHVGKPPRQTVKTKHGTRTHRARMYARVRAHVRTHTCMHMHTHARTHARTHTQSTYKHMHTHVHTHAHACTRAWLHAFVRAHSETCATEPYGHSHGHIRTARSHVAAAFGAAWRLGDK